MSVFSSKEKKAFKRGLFLGLSRNKTKSASKKTNNVSKNRSKQQELLRDIKVYRQRNLGALERNGKIYDTNFVDRPVELSKKELREMRSDYFPDNPNASDMDVADSFVRHMRTKFGVFDKDGKFLHMLGDEEHKKKRQRSRKK